MTEDFTYYGPALTGRHPHIGPMPADATVLQPADMAALRASLAAATQRAEAAEAAVVKASGIVYELIEELAAVTGYTRDSIEGKFLQQPEVQP